MRNALHKALLLILLASLSACSSSSDIDPIDENLVFEEDLDFSEEVEDLDFSGAEADEFEEFTIEEDELNSDFDAADSSEEDVSFDEFESFDESESDSTSDDLAGDFESFDEFDSFDDVGDQGEALNDGASVDEFGFEDFEDFEEEATSTDVAATPIDEFGFNDDEEESNIDLELEADLAFDTPQDEQGEIVFNLPEEPVKPAARPVVGSNKIESIDYFTEVAGGAFAIKTSKMPKFKTEFIPDTKQFILTLLDSEISKKLNRPFLTKDFKQSFKSMSSYQDDEGSVRFVFKLSDGVSSQPKVISETDGVVIRVAEALKTYAKNGEAQYDENGVQIMSEAQSALGGGSTTLDDLLLNKIEFVGRPISIQAKNEEVVNIINFISEDVGANIIVSDSVKGTISLKLNQVPWDQALVVIMKAKGLGYVRNGNILRIASIEELKTEALAAEQVAAANKKFAPFHVKVFPLSYAKPSVVEEKIKPFLTATQGEGQAGGQVISEERSSSLIVRDRLDVIKNISKLIKEMDQPPLQVMIRAKIIEANKNFQRELGSRFGVSFNSTTIGGSPGASGSFAMTPEGVTNGTLSAFGLDFFGNLTQTLRISELESNIRVLSSPSVMAINNEKALIVQSDQVLTPQIIQQQGANTILGDQPPATFQRDEVELRLEVTPQVSSDGNVIMELLVKRQVAQNPVSGVRPISSREAQTKVIVGNNKTAMIGGVYQTSESKLANGVPLLRRIPLIKWLFGREEVERIDTELVIFLTPKVINSKGAKDPLSPAYEGGAVDFTAQAPRKSL